MLDIRIATPQRHEQLTIFPLVTPAPVELPYRLLVEALAGGTVRITEVGQGAVPRLFAANEGEDDVLILDGEQLIGARQNRMTNRSILLPARSKTEIPVSCMEQGRWRFVSREMQAAPQHSPSKVRRQARKAEAKVASAGAAAGHEVLASAQGAVWDSIHETASTLRSGSHTGALDHVYRDYAGRLAEWSKSFPRVDGQIGLLAFVRDRPLGLDVIGGRELYARVHDRLLTGYLMDGLEAQMRLEELRRPGVIIDPAQPTYGEAAAQRFLEAVRGAPRVEAPTVGRGSYRVLTDDVVGGELTDDGRLVHLSAFPEDDEQERRVEVSDRDPEISPPSRRRRAGPRA